MAIKFDFSQVLQNSYLMTGASSSGSWTSQDYSQPSSQEVFRSYINPGHQNNADWIEYYLFCIPSRPGSSVVWQIKPRGSTVWTALASGAASSVASKFSGVYDTSQISLPADVRLLLNCTHASDVNITMTNYTNSRSAVRVVGDIST